MIRYQVSVRGDTYAKLKVKADAQGVSIGALVEAIVFPLPIEEAKPAVGSMQDARRSRHDHPTRDIKPPRVCPGCDDYHRRPGGLLDPREFTCALCTRLVVEAPFMEPLGRDDALVTVCASCSDKHPREGGYAFNGPEGPASAPTGSRTPRRAGR